MADHTSKDYDEALERARELVGLMAARVERQLADAIESLQSGSSALIDQILRHEAEVNGLERSIDQFTGQIIARRQPAARDLRLLMALLGATTDLERVGDESKKIALYARSLHSAGGTLLARAVEGFRAVLARLAGIMVEDPRTISACLDILFVAKSLERIGDHCKNIGEHVVYAAMGKDVRHASAQEIEQAIRS